MSGNGERRGEDLEESARKQNSALQGLIEGVGLLLAASRELLARLQGIAPQEQPSGSAAAPDGEAAPDIDKPEQKVISPAPSGSSFAAAPS